MKYSEFQGFMTDLLAFKKDIQDVEKGIEKLCANPSIHLGDMFQDSYVKLLEHATGDTGWVSWFIWDAWYGENAERAKYCSPDKTAATTVRQVYKKIYPESKEVKLKHTGAKVSTGSAKT